VRTIGRRGRRRLASLSHLGRAGRDRDLLCGVGRAGVRRPGWRPGCSVL